MNHKLKFALRLLAGLALMAALAALSVWALGGIQASERFP
jgi:hypothetical protein